VIQCKIKVNQRPGHPKKKKKTGCGRQTHAQKLTIKGAAGSYLTVYLKKTRGRFELKNAVWGRKKAEKDSEMTKKGGEAPREKVVEKFAYLKQINPRGVYLSM